MSNYVSAEDLIGDIASEKSAMSPNFRKIADYILAYPDNIAMLTIREIATALSMNPSTIVRFSKRFDLSGFSELKSLFQSRLRQARHGYLERAQSLQNLGKGGDVPKILNDLHRANLRNLNEGIDLNHPAKIEQAAELILGANKAYICGFRICFSAAFALHYLTRMFVDNVELSHGLGGTIADGVRNIKKGDVLVAISTEPYTQTTVSAVRYARKRGAAVLALTDGPQSPIAGDANLILNFRPHGPPVLDSIVPIVALVEALCAVMILKGGEASLQNLQDSINQLTEFAAYSNNQT